MAGIRIENLTKTYPGGSKAVDQISLSIADGEFIVLVGPSGCGKSTTLRMVAGLETITSGTIHIGERLVNDLPPKARDIAMVFQNYALYPHMSVEENMAFGLKLRKVPKEEIRRRVAETAAALGLEPYLKRRPSQLSGGQRQRVAVGRAIVRQPAAFLFDEPLSNLDAKMRVEMREEIHRLHRRLGATMLYVTHDQTEAMTLADRVVVMNSGVILQTGAPLEVYNRPANLFTAAFIGTPPMNLVPEGDCILGFRPEDALLTAETGSFALPEGVVELLEPVGAETIAHVNLPGCSSRIQVRLSPDAPIREGQHLSLHIKAGRRHLFDAATGQRVADR